MLQQYFFHLFRPVLKRKIVKSSLSKILEEKEVKSTISHPDEINYKIKGKMEKITKQSDDEFWYLTNIEYIRKNFKTSLVIDRTKKLNIKDDSSFVLFKIIPSYIIVDIGEGKIEMTNKVTFLDHKKANSPRHLYFDYKNETVSWSDQFPEVPYYGKWEWK